MCDGNKTEDCFLCAKALYQFQSAGNLDNLEKRQFSEIVTNAVAEK